MSEAVAFTLVGFHLAGDESESEEPYFDAVDLIVHLADGSDVALGLRTTGFLNQDANLRDDWDEGYRPLSVTLDFSTVPFWDFNEVLWIGPGPTACLAWSNAQGFSLRGLEYVLRRAGPSSPLLAGPDGKGLPTPDAVGLIARPDSPRRQVKPLDESVR